MANRRNHEWPQASAWDGFFTQDKPGGVTERVDPLTVRNALVAAGFMGNLDPATPTDGQVLTYSTTSGKWRGAASPVATPLASATPLVESGAGAVGVSAKAAREDHVHPAYGGGGGTGGGVVKYASTMKAGSQTANVGLNAAGGPSQWAAHGTILVPEGDLPLVQNASKFATICPQPVSGASFIFAIYAWPDTGSTMTLVASTAVQVMPGSSSWLEAVMTSASVTLTGGRRYFFVILWNGNGATLAGTNGAALNVQPYIAFLKTNMGTLSAAPSTITPEGEVTAHFFGRVVT